MRARRWWRALGLVIGRELRESARRRSMWVTAVLVLVGSIALVVLPEVLGGGDDRRTVATSGTAPEGFEDELQAVAGALELEVEVRDVGGPAALDAAVEDDRADVGVDFAGAPPTLVVRADGDDELSAVVRQAVDQVRLRQELTARGLSSAEIGAAVGSAQPRVRAIDAAESGRSAVAFVASLALYLLLLLLTTSVASGVAIEKSKRISEVLLAIVEPTTLLFGKIIGVALLGVVTLAAGALPIVVKALVGGDLPPATGTTLAASAAWFVLGTALYLTTAGALGALVDRQEQVGSVVAPLSLVLVVAYLASVSTAGSDVGGVLAVVPLTSPLVMPARLALGEATGAEVVASLAVLVVSVAVVGRLATVVYQRAIVRTGRRLHVREVLRPVTR